MPRGTGCDVIRKRLPDIPDSAGVYKMLDASSRILYIGKANNLRNRVASYTRVGALPVKMAIMVAQVASVEFIVTATEEEALLLEARLIRSLQPKYNILLKDDKSYPFIALDPSHVFPRLFITRSAYAGKKQNIAGPFASKYYAIQTLAVVRKICKVRSCTDQFFKARTRPCVEYDIKRCSAPCVGKISREEYAVSLKQALGILAGNARDTIRDLYTAMKAAGDEQNYEKAIIIRDRVFALEKLSQTNRVSTEEPGDYIGIFRNDDNCCAQIFRVDGNNMFGNICYFLDNVREWDDSRVLGTLITRHYLLKEIKPLERIVTRCSVDDKDVLERAICRKYGVKCRIVSAKNDDMTEFLSVVEHNAEVALCDALKIRSDTGVIFADIVKIFDIGKPINVIEVFDNSHISGGMPVSAIIAADRRGFVKSRYRIFNMDDVALYDDYAMLRAVLERHLSDKTNKEYPDLLLIDGGRGHLNTALRVLKSLDLDIPCVCIAKGKQRKASLEKFYMSGRKAFSIREHEAVFRYLQKLRDEAHRFAISSHRRRRTNYLLKSFKKFE